MNISIRSVRSYIIYLSLFILTGFVVGPLIDNLIDANVIKATIYFVLIAFWTTSIGRRILIHRIRILLYILCGLETLLLILQTLRAIFVQANPIFIRFTLYSYYVPIIFICYISVLVSTFLVHIEDKKTPLYMILAGVFSAFLAVLAVTNDFHQLLCVFPNGLESYKESFYYGPLYYVIVIWSGLLITHSAITIFKRSSITTSKKLFWFPMIFLTLLTIYYVLHETRIISIENITYYFKLAEIIAVTITCYWESCVQIGFIPANNDYDLILRESTIAANIYNDNDQLIYASKKSKNINLEKLQNGFINDDARVHSTYLNGGTMYWLDDITDINLQKKKLEEINEQLSESIELTIEENKLKEEHALYEAASRVYDEVSKFLEPKLKVIQGLLSDKDIDEDSFRQNLAIACVYNAYVKRRSNLAIIAMGDETISIQELYYSIYESLHYVNLLGKSTSVGLLNNGSVNSIALISLYDYFERIIESILYDFDSLLCNIDKSGGQIVLKLNISSQNNKVVAYCLKEYTNNITIEDDEMFAIIKVDEEGRCCYD